MRAAWPWVAGALMDLGVGLSLGSYYTVTYFGRAQAPLPGFVALGAPFQYYVLVGGVQDTRVQAWLWMACFPLVGIVWRASVWLSGRLAGQAWGLGDVYRGIWASGWPLLVPLPVLIACLGYQDGQFAWSNYVSACLRRRFELSPEWLSPVYFGAAGLSLVIEVRAVWRRLEAVSALRRVAVLTLALVALLVVIAIVGAAADLARAAG